MRLLVLFFLVGPLGTNAIETSTSDKDPTTMSSKLTTDDNNKHSEWTAIPTNSSITGNDTEYSDVSTSDTASEETMASNMITDDYTEQSDMTTVITTPNSLTTEDHTEQSDQSSTENYFTEKTLPECEDGWFEYRDFCYKGSDLDLAEHWPNARQDCLEQGADLFSFQDNDEYNYVVSHLPPYRRNVWIGLTDIAVEGDHRWTDNTKLTNTHWAGEQPDNWDPPTGEQCVELYGGRVWNDVACNNELSWLCKRHKAMSGQIPSTLCRANSSLPPIRLKFTDNNNDEYILESPNFPYYYPIDQNCIWILETDDAHDIRLDIEVYNTISDIDSITIGSGDDPSNASSILIHRGRFLDNHVLHSNNGKIWVRWSPNTSSYFIDQVPVEFWVAKKTFHESYGRPFPIDLEQFGIEEKEESYWTSDVGEYDPSDDVSAGNKFGFRLRLQSVPKGDSQCPLGDFDCDNGNCARSSGVCNGIDDCVDLSDETLCRNEEHEISLSCAFDKPDVNINIMRDKEYTFFSPNWPSYYINHLSCTWIIHASEDLSILVVIMEIDTEISRDYLEVGEGESPPNGTIWKTSGKPKTRLIFSAGNALWVQMTTSIVTYVEVTGFAFQIKTFNDTEFQPTCNKFGRFTCSNGFCIDVDGVCDGIQDCTDASDETDCECEDIDRTLIPGNCPLKLGMETGIIQDFQITASNYTDDNHKPEFGRLGNSSFWRANASEVLPWIQISFEESTIISVVALKVMGEPEGDLVQSFQLEYSQYDKRWQTYHSLEHGEDEVLRITNPYCTEITILTPQIQATSVRIRANEHNIFMGLQIELSGCKATDCDYTVGIASLANNNFTSSSDLSSYNGAHSARLETWKLRQPGWIPANNAENEWLQVHLNHIYTIHAVVTQGCGNEEFWVTLYQISYSHGTNNMVFFKNLNSTEPQEFEGNTDRNGVSANQLSNNIDIDRIRFHPVEWYRGICMRVEMIGCVKDIPECQIRHTSCDLTRKCNHPKGQLASVNFPYQYFYQGSSCTWQIATRGSTYIIMTFLAFDVPSWDECISSFLSIYDGANDRSYVIGQYCNLRLPPTTIRTGFNFGYLWLRTTTGNPGEGFRLDYISEVFTPAEASSNATESCPENWKAFHGNCFSYKKSATFLRWTAAEELCKKDGGHLASIRNEEEMEVIHTLLTEHSVARGSAIYIGLSLNSTTGLHRWTDGRPLTYSNWFIPLTDDDWSARQPDGGKLEACALIVITSLHTLSQWYDVPCASNEADQYICVQNAISIGNSTEMLALELPDMNTTGSSNLCLDGMFQCLSGECVRRLYVCDSISDCSDGSDEQLCNTGMTTFRQHDISQDCGDGVFKCSLEGDCIVITFVCDFIQHCLDNTDEEGCVYRSCDPLTEFTCDNKQCISMGKRCDLQLDCVDGSDERLCETSLINIQCYDGTWLPGNAYCDGQRDCAGKNWEDEPITCLNHTCSAENIQCTNGACVESNNRCQYGFDEFGFPIGCRDATHLIKCDNFECPPGSLKCPGSHCIALQDRCNGVWDCPNGEDELICDSFVCPGSYRCHNQRMCVESSKVCDGIRTCPEGDDELFCHNTCPNGCTCNGLFYVCNGVSWTSMKADLIPRDIRQLTLTQINVNVSIDNNNNGDLKPKPLVDLTYLDVSKFHMLLYLDLNANGIATIIPKTFHSNNNLRVLILSHNMIQELNNATFEGLNALQHLDLSMNPITRIKTGVFKTAARVMFLDIRGTAITEPMEEMFHGLIVLDTLFSDRYLFCCLVRGLTTVSECLPEPDQFSSCEDLMRIRALRIFIWILGISALIGNGFVVFWRLRPTKRKGGRKSNHVQSILVLNLAIADGLMGVYMIIIASADMYYRDVYIAYAEQWQTSYICKIAGFLSVLSSEASVVFMTVISVDRYLCIALPFSQLNLTPKSSKIAVCSVWGVGIVLSLMPVLIKDYFGDEFYGRSSVCLALPLTTDKPAGWEYSVALFLVVNMVAFLVIFASYMGIYIVVKSSANKIKRSGKHQAEQIEFALRMAFLVITDFVCWMPIIIMGLLSLTGAAEVPGIVYVWIAVFVLPINSSLNPYLFTILTRELSKRQTRKSIVKANITSTVEQSTLDNIEDESNVMKFATRAFSNMKQNHILPYMEQTKCRSMQLSSYVKNGVSFFTSDDVNNIENDLKEALVFLARINTIHGNVTEDFILIEKIPDGSRHAYLMLPDSSTLLSTRSNHQLEGNGNNDDTQEHGVIRNDAELLEEVLQRLRSNVQK